MGEATIIWASLATTAALIFLLLAIRYRTEQKRDEIAEEELENERRSKILRYIPGFIDELKDAECLAEIFITHLRIWGAGIRNHNLGPDQYGMFRTKDILTMGPDEVFLGGVFGLNTHTLTWWEERRSSDPEAYKTVLAQYQTHLISNLQAFRF